MMSFLRLSSALPLRPSSFTHSFLHSLSQQPHTTALRTTRMHTLHTRPPLISRRPLRLPPSRRPNSTNSTPTPARPSPDPTSHLGSPPVKPALSLSQRLKQLGKEYGWAAFGVYMALSALDFPFCFLAVRLVGTERIGELEHAVVGRFKKWVLEPLKGTVGLQAAEQGIESGKEAVEQKKEVGWGVEEAQEALDNGNATLWTQLVLAYAIHKSFIFIRVPLTAAVTPRVVKTLRSWGWKIGKATPKTT